METIDRTLRLTRAALDDARRSVLELPAGGAAQLVAPYGALRDDGGVRLWVATLNVPGGLAPYLGREGRPIRYGYVPRAWPLSDYQTIFAREFVEPGQGWTDLVVDPTRGLFVVDGLLTGLHEPRASHLAILESLAGREHLARAYDAALAAGYLWHEFGDVHLLLPGSPTARKRTTMV